MNRAETEHDGGQVPGSASSCSAPSGSSLIEAILNKYGSMESGLHEMGDIKVYFSAPAKKNKQEQPTGTPALKLPSILVLNRCNICKAGEEEKFVELCRPVQELDLAENALNDWTEIMAIATRIPNLEFLNLSSNPLHQATPLASNFGQVSMDTINRLVLNNTKLTWETVHNVLKCMPRLEELHLSQNDFTGVEASSERYPNLKLLHFNNNQTTDWREIQKFGSMFPELETLILMQNPINELNNCFPDDFPRLKSLCISKTLIDSWEEVEKLNDFASLTDIVLSGIPLLLRAKGEKAAKDLRQIVIARLGKLVMLNRSQISEQEREGAEREFVRLFKDSNDKPKRYEELVQKHGRPQELANVNLEAPTKFNCQLRYKEYSVDIVVNVKDTVLRFKKQIGALIGQPPSKFRLYSQGPDAWGGPELVYPNRLMLNYSLYEGTYFTVVTRFKNGDKESSEEYGSAEAPQTIFNCHLIYDGNSTAIAVDVMHSASQLKEQVGHQVGLPPSSFRLFYKPKRDESCEGEWLKFPTRLLFIYKIKDGDKFEVVPKT